MENVIEARDLGKKYAGHDEMWAVRDLSLTVRAGETTILMGPSGSGKTTLLSMIGGLTSPTEGTLHVCGEPIGAWREAKRQRFRRRHIGLIFQSYNLLGSLTAAQNVAVGLALRGQGPDEAEELLRQVGLGLKCDAYPHELSGGQRQRVAIARCLAGCPSVILADEPTAALDAEQGRLVMGLLRRRARATHTAVLVVTHDPRVKQFADRVIELEDGRLQRIMRRVATACA